LVDLCCGLDRVYRRDFDRQIHFRAIGRFDQQVTTEAHLDGAPDESVLVLGYEPTSVASRLLLLDYTRAAADRGMTPKQFLERFNPMVASGRDVLNGYATEVQPFHHAHYQVAVINNSPRSHAGRPRHARRTAQGRHPRPDCDAMVNSILLHTADPGEPRHGEAEQALSNRRPISRHNERARGSKHGLCHSKGSHVSGRDDRAEDGRRGGLDHCGLHQCCSPSMAPACLRRAVQDDAAGARRDLDPERCPEAVLQVHTHCRPPCQGVDSVFHRGVRRHAAAVDAGDQVELAELAVFPRRTALDHRDDLHAAAMAVLDHADAEVHRPLRRHCRDQHHRHGRRAPPRSQTWVLLLIVLSRRLSCSLEDVESTGLRFSYPAPHVPAWGL
jgi:hypothetical protein